MKGLISNATAGLACLLAVAGFTGCTHTCGVTGGCGNDLGWSAGNGPSGGCGGGKCNGGCGGKCCGAGACGGHGDCDWDLYDRCYPDRYWYLSRKEVNALMAGQVLNGHVLDQTIWTHFFECGTDKLTCGGQDKLAYLARRRPCPDTTIYLQTANDVPYDCACPDQVAAARQDLDTRRVQAIQKFLVQHTAGRPVDFQVLIHDPADPSVSAVPIGTYAIPSMYARYTGAPPLRSRAPV
jgi:hypothetical protein